MSIVRYCLLIASLSWSSISFAEQKLMSFVSLVSQSMSALYMVALSQGDTRYQTEYDKLKSQSLSVLPNEHSFHQRWLALTKNMKFTYDKDYEWDFHHNLELRNDIRSFHSEIYEALLESEIAPSNQNALKLAACKIEVLAARYNDITSSIDGIGDLSTRDLNAINPSKISGEIKKALTKVSKTHKNINTKKLLDKTLFKWTFLEKNITSYSQQDASFMIYSTKNSINRSLAKISI